MITISTYQQYFASIVKSYSKLNSVYNIDMFEFDSFLQDLRGRKIQVPTLVLEAYQIDTIANGQYNVHNNLSCALTVLGYFDKRKVTYESKTTFLTEMEEIIMQVRAKMLHDSRTHCKLMTGLLPESMKIAKTETIADGFQGFRMTFNIHDTDSTELTEDWK